MQLQTVGEVIWISILSNQVPHVSVVIPKIQLSPTARTWSFLTATRIQSELLKKEVN